MKDTFPLYVRIYFGTTYCKLLSPRSCVSVCIRDQSVEILQETFDYHYCTPYDHVLKDEAQYISKEEFEKQLRTALQLISFEASSHLTIQPLHLN